MDWTDRIGRRVKLRDLHVLIAVAECGSMAKASARLAITLPVVSKTISDLEKNLGKRLFDRSARGVAPTLYGAELLKCSFAVFDEMRQGFRRIEFLANPNSGELSVGCSEIILAGMMQTIAEQFLLKYPCVDLRVVNADTALWQFDQLRERKVDLIVGRLPHPFVEDDLVAGTLFDEPFEVFASSNSPWVRRRTIRLEELMDEPWVLPPYESVPGSLIAEIFQAHDLPPPRPRMATLSVQLTAALVASGKFVGLIPRSVLHFGAKQLPLKALPVQLAERRVVSSIITVKDRTSSPLAVLFIDFAREMAGSMSQPKTRRVARHKTSGR